MKVLYIANNQTNDFLSDAVFHGLSSLEDVEVVDLNPLWYMYNDINPADLLNRFHGRGFTYYASLPAKNVDRNNIEYKIKTNYFDKVIYGNIRRCIDLFDLVQQCYNTEQIILLDGNDEHNQPGVWNEFVDRGVYYRRELSSNEHNQYPNVLPINFAFPEDKIVKVFKDKTKLLAHVIPGIADTFIFNDEKSYFEDYQESLFGYTWRKAGWDCLRHYEIICNNCIPLFLDIYHCPNTICTTIPKDLLKEYYEVSGIADFLNLREEVQYDDRRCVVVNRNLSKINDIQLNDNFYEIYFLYLKQLQTYAQNNLTTTALAKYIIQ
jgi:hypothetical protein